MSKKIHTFQSSDKKEFDKQLNQFLELGCELHEGGYEVINQVDGVIYSQVIIFHKSEIKFWDNGKIREFDSTNDFETPKGKRIEWYENGNKVDEVNYKDGVRNGLYTRWYENGNKEKECNIKDDVNNGFYREWYKNGNKKN